MMRFHLYASLLVVVSCRDAAHPTARCGAEGHPPMPTVQGGTLFQQSPSECPKAEPKTGDACTREISCEYAATQRGPCEFDSCGCESKSPSDPLTWSCGVAME